MKRTSAITTALALCLVVSLSGCSGGSSLGSAMVTGEQIKLGDATLAFYVSPQSPMDKNAFGYLALVSADGAIRTIRTSGMDTAEIRWNETGLYFADRDSDFLVTEHGMQTIASPKSGHQIALLQPATGDLVGVYSDGFREAGMVESVIVNDGSSSRRSEVAGAFWTLANCGDRVVGVSYSPETVGKLDVPEGGNPPQTVVELFPDTGRIIGSQPTVDGESAHIANDAPCVDNVMRVISAMPNGESQSRWIVASWDTLNGARNDVDLIRPDGTPIELPFDGTSPLFSTGTALSEGQLRWVTAAGDVMSTNVSNGVTTKLFGTSMINGGARLTQAEFTADSVYLFTVVVDPDSHQDAAVSRYDLSSGESEEVVRISGFSAQLPPGMYPRGFAIAPETLAENP